MRWFLMVVLLALASGCSFDGSGGSNAPGDGGLKDPDGGLDWRLDSGRPTDQRIADRGLADGPLEQGAPADALPDVPAPPDAVVDTAPDVLAHDQSTPDVGSVDQSPGVIPVSLAALSQSFTVARVRCVDRYGTDHGTWEPIVDGPSMQFFDAAPRLNGIPESLSDWIGGASAVIVLFDLNACDDEDPVNHDGEWASAGLLVRGATISHGGELVLSADTSTQDIDFLDVYDDGRYEQEVFGVDDSSLPPQLVNPVNEAKRLVLQAAGLDPT